MTIAVKADNRNRLSIRGLKTGRTYLIHQLPEGWLVTPEPEVKPPKRRREWRGPKRDLTEHLDALAREGFEFKRTMAEEAPACRF